MRYIEIDGERHDVDECFNCPCYDGGDGGWGECCKHPRGDGASSGIGASSYPKQKFGTNCPLRVKERDPDKVCVIDWPEGEGEE